MLFERENAQQCVFVRASALNRAWDLSMLPVDRLRLQVSEGRGSKAYFYGKGGEGNDLVSVVRIH